MVEGNQPDTIMTDTIQDKAESAVNKVLDVGQTMSDGTMSASLANLRDAHAVLTDEQNRAARKRGRRPLFRGINLSGVGV